METNQSRIVHFLPSLTDIAFLLPIVLLFTRMDGVKTLLGDGDTGWHIRTGQWILTHHAIPHQDIFSFTKPGAPWFAWEWMSDLIFGFLHSHWGLPGIAIASIVIICLTSAALFRLVLSKCGNRLIAIAVTFLVAIGCSVHWLARPHLFTLLFTVIWLAVLERAAEGDKNLVWLLPFGCILWANLHGGFVLGILLIVTYAAGAVLDGFFSGEQNVRLQHFRKARKYLVVASLSLLASLLNPYGYHLHEHIAGYLNDSSQFNGVAEFQTLSFHHPVAVYLEMMLGLGVLAAIHYIRHRRFTPALLILSWAHLALFAGRNIPLFALISAPFVAGALDELLQSGLSEFQNFPRTVRFIWSIVHDVSEEVQIFDRPWRAYMVPVASMVLLTSVVSANAHVAKFRAEYDPKRYPTGAVSMLALRGAEHRIFCDDEWGDYLAYRLYPTGRVFVDGRTDFYGGKFVGNYLKILGVEYDWQKKLDRYGVDTLLLSTKSAIAETAKLSPRWKVAYDDGVAVVLESSNPKTRISTARGNDHSRHFESSAGGIRISKDERKNL
jgi:hypothetical protein